MSKITARVAVIASCFGLLAACAPDLAAENRAKAGKLLERIQADGFENWSTDKAVALRHTPSGMVCTLPASGALDVGVFPPQAANPGAYCASASDDIATTIVVVHFGDSTDIDTAFAEAVATGAGAASPAPWRGKGSEADKLPPDGLPHFRIARFQTELEGKAHYLRVAVSEARGWYLQQLVSAPIDRAEAAEAKAGRDWRDLLQEFVKPPKSPA